jgi:hypothetical protein
MSMKEIALDLVVALRQNTDASREMIELTQKHFEARLAENAGWAVSRLNHLMEFHRKACGYYNDSLDVACGRQESGEEWGAVVNAVADRIVQALQELGLPIAHPLLARDLEDHYERRVRR